MYSRVPTQPVKQSHKSTNHESTNFGLQKTTPSKFQAINRHSDLTKAEPAKPLLEFDV